MQFVSCWFAISPDSFSFSGLTNHVLLQTPTSNCHFSRLIVPKQQHKVWYVLKNQGSWLNQKWFFKSKRRKQTWVAPCSLEQQRNYSCCSQHLSSSGTKPLCLDYGLPSPKKPNICNICIKSSCILRWCRQASCQHACRVDVQGCEA
jgi:hypothetical protein